MKIITENFSAEQEIKKSKFIAILTPFSDFETTLKNLQITHLKATHIVWAYRFLNENRQIVENQTDNGEPKNSSGVPCLNALRGAELVDTAVFVIRYFGGIKLGVGGLVRAYGSSVNLVISNANLQNFEFKKELKIFVAFSEISKFEYFFKSQNLQNFRNFTENGAEISLNLTESEILKFQNFSKNFSENQLKILT